MLLFHVLVEKQAVKPSDVLPIPVKPATQPTTTRRRQPTLHLSSPQGMKWAEGQHQRKLEKEAKAAAKLPPKPKKRGVDFCPPYTVKNLVYCALCNKGAVVKDRKERWVQCPKCREPMHRFCAAKPDAFCICGETLYVI
jgi:hypothetical protein